MRVVRTSPGGDATQAHRQASLELFRVLLLPAICFLPVLLCLPFFSEPLERDEGVYATIAQGILQGDLPYLDYFDHKPPLVYLWYAISFTLFGEGVVAPRLMAALVWSTTTLVLFWEARLLFSGNVAYLAATIFAASSGLALLQANANTEVFTLLPMSASLYAGTRAMKQGSWTWFVLAGVFGAMAALTKQVACLNLLAITVVCVVNAVPTQGFALAAKRAALVSAGAAGTLLLCLLPFVLTGSLDDFYYANITYNRLYSSELSATERIAAEIGGLLFFTEAAPALVLGGLAAAVSFLASPRHRSALILPVLWVVASQVGVMISGRALFHYYVLLLPGLALLSSYALSSYWSNARHRSLVILFVAVGVGGCIGFHAPAFTAPTPDDRHIAKYGLIYGQPQTSPSRAIAEAIAALTDPHERVYNLGRESQVYFYADRLPATSFMYDRPFHLDPPTFESTMNELERSPPPLIFDTIDEAAKEVWRPSQRTRLRAFLERSYTFAGRIEFADVYVLK